ELMLACDIVVASERAKFGQPEVKLGLIPGFGGTVRLWRKAGPTAAAFLMTTGEMIDAPTALRLGLVNEVLPPEASLDRARAIATTIANQAPLAVQAVKRLLIAGLGTDPETATRQEAKAFGELFASADVR